ncbi:MAG: nucleotide exchange factor GrpE, partial [Candidatus Omnitrophota bacterium]
MSKDSSKKKEEQHNKEMKDQIPKKEEVPLSEKEQLDKKAAEYNQLWDKYVRLCAEFDNSRKRWVKEREEIIRFANFSLLKELIIILDELEQALKIA